MTTRTASRSPLSAAGTRQEDPAEEALADDRFVLYAQPVVDVHTGELVQRELLLRLREPDGEIIAPGAFLQIAEEYGQIGDIDRWVISRGAEIAATGRPVEINLSARSVGDAGVLDHIEHCIENSGIDPTSLVFEITETALIQDEAAARRFAERLHALGCKLALDDFGTGYGGFTYLKQLPLDFVKIDIEFVRDLATNPASSHVVQAVVALARGFGLQTVAEGVEDAETLALLRELGVDLAQGYHIARPGPLAETVEPSSPDTVGESARNRSRRRPGRLEQEPAQSDLAQSTADREQALADRDQAELERDQSQLDEARPSTPRTSRARWASRIDNRRSTAARNAATLAKTRSTRRKRAANQRQTLLDHQQNGLAQPPPATRTAAETLTERGPGHGQPRRAPQTRAPGRRCGGRRRRISVRSAARARRTERLSPPLLRRFAGDRAVFPTVREFRRAGETALLTALRRHGGTELWAARLGLPRRERYSGGSGASEYVRADHAGGECGGALSIAGASSGLTPRDGPAPISAGGGGSEVSRYPSRKTCPETRQT